MLDQQRQIVLVLAQRRQVNVKHVQPEIEILAQMPVGDGLLGILVRGRQHAHVHRRFHLAAEPPDFVILENAQQLRLRRRGHFADFVQQQRAAVGQLEAAEAALRGARKRASSRGRKFRFPSAIRESPSS